MKDFIGNRIGIDINREFQEGESIATVQERIKNSSVFILARFHSADIPYDLEEYFGLGKCGRQDVPSSKIVTTIFAETHAKDSLNGIEDSTAQMSQDAFTLLRENFAGEIWNELVQVVKLKGEVPKRL